VTDTYDDGRIVCDPDRLEIRSYYFPFGTKQAGFVVDLGRGVSPIVTPDEPDAFEAVVRQRAHLGAGDARKMKGPFI